MRRRFPLLLRLGSPLSRESLPSFVTRLAQLNFYDPTTIMNQLCWENTVEDRLDWPVRGETFTRLMALSWADIYDLHAATGHYFAEVLTPPETDVVHLRIPNSLQLPVLSQALARQHLRPASTAQFCPICLRKAPYHRVSWLPIAAAACITHKRLLVDRCPGCRYPVPIRAIVENSRCRHCGADLTKAPSPYLAKDEFGLESQRFISWWLKLSRKPTHLTRYGPLPQLDPQLVFYLLEGVVDCIKALGSDWSYVHQPETRSPLEPFELLRGSPSPSQSYRLHATAFKALIDWPQGFEEFLQAYTSRPGREAKGDIFEDLGRLYSKWLGDKWRSPLFRFVQRALSRHLVAAYVPASSSSSDTSYNAAFDGTGTPVFLSATRAARLLEVSFWSIKRLVGAGFLIGYSSEYGQPRRYGAVGRDEVLLLRLAWEKGVSLPDAAKWLGVTRSIVVHLVKIGLLNAQQEPAANGRGEWVFAKQDLDACYCQVVRALRPGRGYSTLPGAARTLSICGLRVPDIIKLIAERKLGCWSYKDAPGLAQLTFSISDIETLLMSQCGGLELVDGEQAADQIGVEVWTLLHWASSGLLSVAVSYAYKTYFDTKQIDRFLATHITSKEAAALLDVTVEELNLWYWDWGLKGLRGTGADGSLLCVFLRSEVEQLQLKFCTSD